MKIAAVYIILLPNGRTGQVGQMHSGICGFGKSKGGPGEGPPFRQKPDEVLPSDQPTARSS